MKRSKKLIRRIVVSAIGFPLFIVGLILIPLPGPGILTCFLALFILSLEFDWASKYFEITKKKLKEIIDKSKAQYEKSKAEAKDREKN